MTSQVYYRKWRPGRFSDLVGQDHVSSTLRQAIKQGRISHAYLFTGPRGTGKTTTARLLAKSVNCLSPEEGDPCNTCPICQSINQGQSLDIIELDAASNRGIDEIRAIRERVSLAPVEGKRKVYIIDEAHMLTDQASNAFLKTLEEPPAHVIFVLCTTEAHKILATIVSRCQRFDFRRLPSELIYRRLAEIAQAEGVDAAPEALRLVARYAGGSLRDAENLLEQLAVSYGGNVGIHQVEELLGLGHAERWLELLKYLLMGNTAASLGVINQAAWDGSDMRQLHRQTLELLRGMMLLQWGSGDSLDLPDHVKTELRELVGKLPGWRIVKALKLWGTVNTRYDAPSILPLELAAVEICSEEAAARSVEPPPKPTQPVSRGTPFSPGMNREVKRDSPPREASERPAVSASPSERRPTVDRNGPPPSIPSVPVKRPTPLSPPLAMGETEKSPPLTSGETEGSAAMSAPLKGTSSEAGDLAQKWQATIKALSRHAGKKYNLGAVLRGCRIDAITVEGDTLILPFAHRTNMERMQEEMGDPQGRRLISDAVEKSFGTPYTLKLELAGESSDAANSVRSAQHSPMVRAAQGIGARIIEERDQ